MEKLLNIISNQNENPEKFYILKNIIGIGSNSKVYRAINIKKMNHFYSIKICNVVKENINIILNELNILTKLKQMKSKRIIKFYESFYDKKNNNVWIVLEYFLYGDLYDFVHITNFNNQINNTIFFSIFKFIIKNLYILHNQNIIHRDIKLSNILLNEKGYIKIIDFGISEEITKDEEKITKRIGSIYWMSPEIINKKYYNQKTDIYSLGISMIEFLDGEPPYYYLKPYHAIKKIKENPILFVNKYSNEINNFINLCLKEDINERTDIKYLMNHEYIQKFGKNRKFLLEILNNNFKEFFLHKCIFGDDYKLEISSSDNKEENNLNSNNNDENYDLNSNSSIIIHENISNNQNKKDLNLNEIIKFDYDYEKYLNN